VVIEFLTPRCLWYIWDETYTLLFGFWWMIQVYRIGFQLLWAHHCYLSLELYDLSNFHSSHRFKVKCFIPLMFLFLLWGGFWVDYLRQIIQPILNTQYKLWSKSIQLIQISDLYHGSIRCPLDIWRTAWVSLD